MSALFITGHTEIGIMSAKDAPLQPDQLIFTSLTYNIIIFLTQCLHFAG